MLDMTLQEESAPQSMTLEETLDVRGSGFWDVIGEGLGKIIEAGADAAVKGIQNAS